MGGCSRRWEHSLDALAQSLPLFLEQELGIVDQIDEQDMPDLESQIGLRFGSHNVLFCAFWR